LPIYTVELQPRIAGYAQGRFLFNNSVIVGCGDSKAFLRSLLTNRKWADKRIFFYLDAHWEEELPLAEEVEVIFASAVDPVVMVDDFQVPADPGYKFDDYGPGKALTLQYLDAQICKLKLSAFFPAAPSQAETGSKRGCVVLTRTSDLTAKLRAMTTVMAYSGGDRLPRTG
jgi:hypothetical protein